MKQNPEVDVADAYVEFYREMQEIHAQLISLITTSVLDKRLSAIDRHAILSRTVEVSMLIGKINDATVVATTIIASKYGLGEHHLEMLQEISLDAQAHCDEMARKVDAASGPDWSGVFGEGIGGDR